MTIISAAAMRCRTMADGSLRIEVEVEDSGFSRLSECHRIAPAYITNALARAGARPPSG